MLYRFHVIWAKPDGYGCCCNRTNQLAYAHVRLLKNVRVISQTPYFRKVGDRRGEGKGSGCIVMGGEIIEYRRYGNLRRDG